MEVGRKVSPNSVMKIKLDDDHSSIMMGGDGSSKSNMEFPVFRGFYYYESPRRSARGGEDGAKRDDRNDSSSSSSKTKQRWSSKSLLLRRLPPPPIFSNLFREQRRQRRKHQIAMFACGEFWNPQRRFQKLVGVKRVVVGYAGGTYDSPTFHNMEDHTQTLYIEYDPTKVSYMELLQMWYDNDDPWTIEESSHLRSVIFVTNQEQYEEADNFLTSLRLGNYNSNGYNGYNSNGHVVVVPTKSSSDYHYGRHRRTLYVSLEVATTFYPAEECQQDYLLKQLDAAKRQLELYKQDAVPSGLYTILE